MPAEATAYGSPNTPVPKMKLTAVVNTWSGDECGRSAMFCWTAHALRRWRRRRRQVLMMTGFAGTPTGSCTVEDAWVGFVVGVIVGTVPRKKTRIYQKTPGRETFAFFSPVERQTADAPLTHPAAVAVPTAPPERSGRPSPRLPDPPSTARVPSPRWTAARAHGRRCYFHPLRPSKVINPIAEKGRHRQVRSFCAGRHRDGHPADLTDGGTNATPAVHARRDRRPTRSPSSRPGHVTCSAVNARGMGTQSETGKQPRQHRQHLGRVFRVAVSARWVRNFMVPRPRFLASLCSRRWRCEDLNHVYRCEV